MAAISLKVACFIIPLIYSIMLYFLTNRIAQLGSDFVVSLFSAAVIVLIVVIGANILGSGLNATATMMVFVIVFALAFYGISIFGYALPWIPNLFTTSQNWVSFPYKEYVDVILAGMFGFSIYLFIADRSGD